MPVAAFACPSDKKKSGQFHDPEYCVTACDEQCYSPFLMTAIYGLNIRNHHKGRYVSATALSGCKRRLTLERTVNYVEEYKNLYAGFRGTITHTVIEEAAVTKFPSGRTLFDLGFIAEWRMLAGFCLTPGHAGFAVPHDVDIEDLATYAHITCPKCDAESCPVNEQNWIFLGGTLDGGAPVFNVTDADRVEATAGQAQAVIFVDEEGTAHYKLSDIKTMKEYALSYFIKGDPKNTLHPQIKDDYVRQAWVYAYLAQFAEIPEALRKLGIKRLKFIRSDIQGFAMGEAPWTGGGTFRWKDHFKNPLKDWPMHPIEFAPREQVEEYIRVNAEPILDSLILGNSRGPVRDESAAWLCADYCAFFGTDFCPNPQLESDLIAAGVPTEDAFQRALTRPMMAEEKTVGALTEIDTQNIDNFFRKQRGEEPKAKLVKPRAPRKPTTKKKE